MCFPLRFTRRLNAGQFKFGMFSVGAKWCNMAKVVVVSAVSVVVIFVIVIVIVILVCPSLSK